MSEFASVLAGAHGRVTSERWMLGHISQVGAFTATTLFEELELVKFAL